MYESFNLVVVSFPLRNEYVYVSVYRRSLASCDDSGISYRRRIYDRLFVFDIVLLSNSRFPNNSCFPAGVKS